MAETARPESALEVLLHQGTDDDLRRFLLLLDPPQIADLLEAIDDAEDKARVFRLVLGADDQATVLREMEETERVDLVRELEPDEAAGVIEELHTDDAADVLQSLEEEEQRGILQEMAPKERAAIKSVLVHPEDTAGGLMQTELVRVRESGTVREAVQEIRRTREEVGELHEIFVVDDQGRLKGWVKERALILADDDTPIAKIVRPIPVRVPVTMDQEEIAKQVRDYDLSSVPVVDEDDVLVGRILVDDIVDVIEEEATEDIARLAGTGAQDVYEASVFTALKSRSPWLVITFSGGMVAAVIIAAGERWIATAGALVGFIPVIMGMGGGCASQAATVTVRSLALGRIGAGDVWRVVRKEVLVGVFLAVATGLLLWLAAAAVGGSPTVAWIAAFAILSTVTLGTLLGVLTPLLLARIGADPAVATGPFVQTVNDVLGSSLLILYCVLVLD
jgi:magnesium transporter